jgi:hypothetical protein
MICGGKGVGVGDGVLVKVAVGVKVMVGVKLGVNVVVGVSVIVGMKVKVDVMLGVKVTVGVRVTVGVKVGVREGVGVDVLGGPLYSTSMERKSTKPPEADSDQERQPEGTARIILTYPGRLVLLYRYQDIEVEQACKVAVPTPLSEVNSTITSK